MNGWTIFWGVGAFFSACGAYVAYHVYKAPVIEDHPSKPAPRYTHPDHERIINDYTRGRYWS